MSHRYAVLWETAPDHPARPAGLVVEQDDHVLVEARDDLALPRRYDKPFQVLGPDMTVVAYTPRHRQYFDQVVLDLSRGFIIGQEGSVNQATEGVILRLLSELVFRPLRREHTVVYWDTAPTYPTVKAYRLKNWGPAGEPPRTHPERDSPAVRASQRSYVAA